MSEAEPWSYYPDGTPVYSLADGPVPDAMKPDFHGVTKHWIRGFMAFRAGPAPADRNADGA